MLINPEYREDSNSLYADTLPKDLEDLENNYQINTESEMVSKNGSM